MVLPFSRAVKVPVLVAMASNDGAACGGLLGGDCSTAESLMRFEGPNYAPEAKLRTFVLPNYGHALNYAPNAREFFQAAARWSEEMVGR